MSVTRPQTGARLGPYELLALLGAGGMGEVYRARDLRLGRDVALKLLASDTARDPERVRRFELEARAASAIDHPAVVTVHDVGQDGDVRFLVTELLEGETLRERLARSSLAATEVLRISTQLAEGLAAAHARGVHHRDLKPENLFLTTDGRLKILDFGIARLCDTRGRDTGTVSDSGTAPGSVLGTSGYMAPEQVRGLPTDARADVFALGAILYELAAGQRAFPGATAMDRALAILGEEPRPIERSDLPAAFVQLVRRCLERDPEHRLASAGEVAAALRALGGPGRDPSGLGTSEPRLLRAPQPSSATRPWTSRVGPILGAVGLAVASWWSGRTTAPRPDAAPRFERLTYRPGTIASARFAPDGQNIIYTQYSDLEPPRILMTVRGLPDSQEISKQDLSVLSVSKAGELIVSLPSPGGGLDLAQLPLTGGTPRRIRAHAWAADWAPDGRDFALLGLQEGRTVLEFPLGHVVLRDGYAWLGEPRVSPDGQWVAITEHPYGNDDLGFVVVVNRAGERRQLTERFGTIDGLAWMPGGREIVFTAAREGLGRAFFYVSLSGELREGPRAPVDMRVLDVAPDGTVLLKREIMRLETIGKSADAEEERDLCWFDWGVPVGITDDGRHYLFTEGGAAGAARYIAYYRDLQGGPPMRVGHGYALALSGDGKQVLLLPDNDHSRLAVMSTDLGAPRPLDPGPIRTYDRASFFPGAAEILILGRDAGGVLHLYRQSLAPSSPPRVLPIEAPLATNMTLELDPQGRELIIGVEKANAPARFELETGKSRPVAGLERQDTVMRWLDSGNLLVMSATTSRCRLDAQSTDPHRKLDYTIQELDPDTGRREERLRLFEQSINGRARVHDWSGKLGGAVVSRNGQAYVFAVREVSSDLYLMRL